MVSGKLLALSFIVPDKGSSNAAPAFLEYTPLYRRYLALLGLCYCVGRGCRVAM